MEKRALWGFVISGSCLGCVVQEECSQSCLNALTEKLQVAANIDCSHLCNNKLCVNAGHLSFEPRAVNNARKYCFGEGVCVGHDGYPRLHGQFVCVVSRYKLICMFLLISGATDMHRRPTCSF